MTQITIITVKPFLFHLYAIVKELFNYNDLSNDFFQKVDCVIYRPFLLDTTHHECHHKTNHD